MPIVPSGPGFLSYATLLNRLRAEIEKPLSLRYVRLQWVRFQSDRHLIELKIAILVLLVVLVALT